MKFAKYISLAAGLFLAASCSDYTPNGYTETPTMPSATDIEYTISGQAGHVVNLTWTIPGDTEVTGCVLYRDARQIATFDVTPDRKYTYTAYGTALGEDVVYTVKVKYANGSISLGKSAVVHLPAEELAGVHDLKTEVNGRNVKFSWRLPAQDFRTGIRLMINDDETKAILLPADATSYTFRTQPMETPLLYTIEVIYDTYYYSPEQSVEETLPYIEPKMLFLLPEDVATWTDLADDDELAAATWFAAQSNAYFCHPSEIDDYDASAYPVMWVMVDRVGLEFGWQNLPGGFGSESTIKALRNYSDQGGNLFLSNFATQLTLPLGFVPAGYEPTVFGNGEGGNGDDVWVINALLGVDFKGKGDDEQGFYDRTAHAIFKDLTFEDPNKYGYDALPLIGPGHREDHNCLWDCNIYGRGTERDVIKNFELTTNSLVLATWGHVRDHCVAGLVDFYANAQHNRCVAMGLAAYEWNQNSGPNPYQGNIEKLTSNILDYLK